jgi:hypothetical protein
MPYSNRLENRIEKLIDIVKAKADKALVEVMGFLPCKVVREGFELYLSYHAPEWQKKGCVTIDIFGGEVEAYCYGDKPREEFLKNDVALRLGGRYIRNYRGY